MQPQIYNDIAGAIKDADSTYFFEDYAKQANAVVRALEKKGFTIVPKNPTEAMVTTAAENIFAGKVRPEEHVKHVYATMLAAAKRG